MRVELPWRRHAAVAMKNRQAEIEHELRMQELEFQRLLSKKRLAAIAAETDELARLEALPPEKTLWEEIKQVFL